MQFPFLTPLLATLFCAYIAAPLTGTVQAAEQTALELIREVNDHVGHINRVD